MILSNFTLVLTRADVLRIREVLRALGATWKMPYKTDDATYAGKYRVRGDTRISLYFE